MVYKKAISSIRDATEFFPFMGFRKELEKNNMVIDWDEVYWCLVDCNRDQKLLGCDCKYE